MPQTKPDAKVEEVAAHLKQVLDEADTARSALDRYLEIKSRYDEAFWREVMSVFAKMRR